MICIPIAAESNALMRRLLERASAEPADLYELRLDHIAGPPDVEGLIAASDRPILATCRAASLGGGFEGTRAQRLAILQRAVDAGAAYVDCDEDVVADIRRKNGVVVIASWHDFSGVPGDLRAIVDRLAATPCDWVKFAVAATRAEDNGRVLDALAKSGKPAIAVAMGEIGLPSRILGPAHGSKITFGALSSGLESAPGQPTARELAELYRVKSLTAATAVYGLIGDPIAHSLGYKYHNRAFAGAGIDAVYIPFQCSDAMEFLAAVPARLGVRGLSVTMPHKHAALDWADSATDVARSVGAANTLVRRAGGWVADNTDFPAVRDAISECAREHGIDLQGKPTLVLGAGGAAKAVGAALADTGCCVHVAARDWGKAKGLASATGWTAVSWRGRNGGDWAVVANATPLGMSPRESDTPFPADGWKPGIIAFETVYRPRETRFLREASLAGAWTVDGLEMFIRQAAGQFEAWIGASPPAALCLAKEPMGSPTFMDF